MSGYEQFQRLIYWNRVTNTQYLNNMINSYDRLYKQFQIQNTKRQKQEQANLKRKDAEYIYNTVSKQINRNYPQWSNYILNNKEHQIEVISGQLTSQMDKNQLQTKIVSKIINLIKSIENNNELRMYESMLYTSDVCLSKQQIRANDNMLIKNWINMLNLFLISGYYNLLIQKKEVQIRQKKDIKQGYIYISYYKNQEESNHKRMGISFIQKNTDLKLFFYLYHINDKNRACCQQNYNQKWLYQQANQNQDSHPIDKFLFIIYLANIEKLSNYQGVFQPRTQQKQNLWKLFEKKLPGILGYLLNNNLYEAYAYLNQSRFLK